MGNEDSPRVTLAGKWRALLMRLRLQTSLRHSVSHLSFTRKLFHWLFISYFTLILPAGQVVAVLASDEVILAAGELRCYTQHLEDAERNSTESHHHPGEHSHGGLDHHVSSSRHPADSDIPYIHCDPLTHDFALASLLLPLSLTEMLFLSDGLGVGRQLVAENLAICFRSEPPPTPPPRDLLFL